MRGACALRARCVRDVRTVQSRYASPLLPHRQVASCFCCSESPHMYVGPRGRAIRGHRAAALAKIIKPQGRSRVTRAACAFRLHARSGLQRVTYTLRAFYARSPYGDFLLLLIYAFKEVTRVSPVTTSVTTVVLFV